MGIAVASVPAPLHLHFSPLSHTKTRQLRLVRRRNLKTSPSKPLNYLLSFSTLFSASATEEGPPPLSLPEDSLDVQSNTDQLPLSYPEWCLFVSAGVVKHVEERKWKGDAMVREEYKVELLQFQALVGGQLRLTGLVLAFWLLVVGISVRVRTWMRLSLEEGREQLPRKLMTLRLSPGKIFSMSYLFEIGKVKTEQHTSFLLPIR